MTELDRLIALLSKLPGLGPRSARRAALHLIERREQLLRPLASALTEADARVRACTACGNLDTTDPCGICTDETREPGSLCVVEDVRDLWALERSGAFRGRYHVLGGTLSALDGRGPDALRIAGLLERVKTLGISEVILAMNATVEGQTTAHYVAELLEPGGVRITRLAQGVPLGGELDYLDDGTLKTALRARRPAS